MLTTALVPLKTAQSQNEHTTHKEGNSWTEPTSSAEFEWVHLEAFRGETVTDRQTGASDNFDTISGLQKVIPGLEASAFVTALSKLRLHKKFQLKITVKANLFFYSYGNSN